MREADWKAPARVSTFPGDQPEPIEGQMSLFEAQESTTKEEGMESRQVGPFLFERLENGKVRVSIEGEAAGLITVNEAQWADFTRPLEYDARNGTQATRDDAQELIGKRVTLPITGIVHRIDDDNGVVVQVDDRWDFADADKPPWEVRVDVEGVEVEDA